MKIAVPYENGNVFGHFGKTENFKMYDAEHGKTIKFEIVSTDGKGHGEHVAFLAANGVDILLCGGIGDGARTALENAGIKLYGGVTGNTDEVVESFLGGSLHYNPEAHCTHHEHEHGAGGHTCGAHGCGKHGE